MFCTCCRLTYQPRKRGFYAEAADGAFPGTVAALARRALYKKRTAYSAAPVFHPVQAEFIVRGASILTMDPDVGDLSPADLYVRDGVIVEIGHNLNCRALLEIDGRGMLALPGFIDDHRHVCAGALTPNQVADSYGLLPDLSSADAMDIYRVIRLALLDAISVGVTTVHHCASDIGGEHSDTAILAQIDSGVRGRFSFPLGPPSATSTPHSRDALKRLQRDWFFPDNDHLLDLGVAISQSESVGDRPGYGEELGLPVVIDHISDPIPADDAGSATPDAGRALNLDHRVGTLSPGKQADLILLRGELWNASESISLGQIRQIIKHATAADVILVAIDGRLRKQNGVLTEPNEGLIRREGRDAIVRLHMLAKADFH
jgi:cytosine/adenosine deaminase-related metal-dependent hydrolase